VTARSLPVAWILAVALPVMVGEVLMASRWVCCHRDAGLALVSSFESSKSRGVATGFVSWSV